MSVKKEKEEKSCLSEIKRLPWRFSRQILGQKETIKIKRKLGFSNPNTVRMVAQKYGLEVLRRAYKKNLQMALKTITKLMPILTGKTVITADHGELLGEENLFGHFHRLRSQNPYLREIPWFEVTK
ncbi:hypothetical protein AKJ64_04505 [candidate division MSBL1 archaeon SCGC-AAA259E17]|uniref:Uncharacterized protein n=1 Tax=candidate division MSBL1 archaeon SCGC-AAA259E17 TaxID=1698263 RepID=A0A133UC61_9EURY|nr:hypothetical protein AKJ64_04505 [candidate division MSBL1 archaeon SCGC-AAA259E17]